MCLLSLLRHVSSSENGSLKNLICVTDCYCTFLFQVFVILKKQFRVFIYVFIPFLFFFFVVVAVSSSGSALDTLPSTIDDDKDDVVGVSFGLDTT